MDPSKRFQDLTPAERLRSAAETLRAVPRTLALVWVSHRGLTVALASLSALQGLQPVAHTWLGKLVIDAVGAGLAGGAPPPAPWSDALVPLAETLGLGAVPLAPYALGVLLCWG